MPPKARDPSDLGLRLERQARRAVSLGSACASGVGTAILKRSTHAEMPFVDDRSWPASTRELPS
jgi:hypothetical protein